MHSDIDSTNGIFTCNTSPIGNIYETWIAGNPTMRLRNITHIGDVPVKEWVDKYLVPIFNDYQHRLVAYKSHYSAICDSMRDNGSTCNRLPVIYVFLFFLYFFDFSDSLVSILIFMTYSIFSLCVIRTSIVVILNYSVNFRLFPHNGEHVV